MDVAITGSTGLIGTALAERLNTLGHRVVKITRGDATSASDEIHWSPGNGDIDSAGLEGVDAVVHLAGEPIAKRRWSDAQRARLVDSRVDGTTLLAATLATLQRPPKTMLSASAIGYYGNRGDRPLDEEADPGDDFLAGLCVKWESSTAAAADAGIRVAHLRTGIVLDPNGGALAKMLPLFRLGLGGQMGAGTQWWSWITLEDHVTATVHALSSSLDGPVNLTAPQPVTNAEFTKALGNVLHRPTVLRVPKVGPSLLLGQDLAQALLFNSARVLPRRLEADGMVFAHPDIDRALGAVLDSTPRGH